MLHYPKIDTMFERADDFNVDVRLWRRPEFEYVNKWLVMEKLDGANISILATKNSTIWRGRTEKSEFIPDIQNHLNLRVENWHAILQEQLGAHLLDSIEIFGEIYGPKIQNGGIYGTEIKTKFYDIRVNENLWLDHKTVLSYADLLDFELPKFGYNSSNGIVNYCYEGFHTYEPDGTGQAEGLIAKTDVPLYNNNGTRLICKLKTSDFNHGKRK